MAEYSFSVRPAAVSDAAAIAAVNVASWQETYAGLLPSEVIARVTQEARTRMWTAILNGTDMSGSLAVFVAEREDETVGYISVGNQRDEGLVEGGFSSEITAFYVLKSAQRKGVGRTLLNYGFHHLVNHNHTSTALWVLDTNRNACGFYEANGGHLISEREETRPDTTLRELAYGWYGLRSLNTSKNVLNEV
jgi:ribosomal protein S18 acetylase RimI-like enzyme